MEKDFLCGMFIGALTGALVVANSCKARKLVKDGQEQIKNKVSEMTKQNSKKTDDYEDLGE